MQYLIVIVLQFVDALHFTCRVMLFHRFLDNFVFIDNLIYKFCNIYLFT